MESTGRPQSPARTGRWRWLTMATSLLLLLTIVATPAIRAQESTEAPETPDVVIPGTGQEDENASPETTAEPEPTEEPAAETTSEATPQAEQDQTSSSGQVTVISATDVGNPAVVAQGLAFLSGDRSVWQVREVNPEGSSKAAAAVSNAAFIYQVKGSSIVRNDVTGKRALLETGESFFKAGGDAYTTIADSADSEIWIFEVVGPNDVENDAFYESPLIEDYDEGVFDMQLIRYVLEPGETATLPGHTGPALVMSSDGDIDIESNGLGLLGTGDGQLITEDATVTNNSENPAVFLLAAFGSEVGEASASPGTGVPATTENGDTATTPVADDSTTQDTTPDTATNDSTDSTDDSSSDGSQTGTSQTSINITAQAELYVVVVADGVTVFDGPIPQGGQSGVIVGSSFEVYTSNGGATLFTNACGDEFFMGFETGEARYYLAATESSCAP